MHIHNAKENSDRTKVHTCKVYKRHNLLVLVTCPDNYRFSIGLLYPESDHVGTLIKFNSTLKIAEQLFSAIKAQLEVQAIWFTADIENNKPALELLKTHISRQLDKLGIDPANSNFLRHYQSNLN